MRQRSLSTLGRGTLVVRQFLQLIVRFEVITEVELALRRLQVIVHLGIRHALFGLLKIG